MAGSCSRLVGTGCGAKSTGDNFAEVESRVGVGGEMSNELTVEPGDGRLDDGRSGFPFSERQCEEGIFGGRGVFAESADGKSVSVWDHADGEGPGIADHRFDGPASWDGDDEQRGLRAALLDPLGQDAAAAAFMATGQHVGAGGESFQSGVHGLWTGHSVVCMRSGRG